MEKYFKKISTGKRYVFRKDTVTRHHYIFCRGVPVCVPQTARPSPYAMDVNLTAGERGYSPTVDISYVHLPTNPVGAAIED